MKPFGPYTKLSRLGAGGTAEVWLASGPHPRGEELLALKIILAHRADDEALRQMMVAEMRTAEHLQHPNIAEVFHIGEEEGLPYLAMEFVRGWTLSSITKKLNERGQRLSLAEACLIVHDAAKGLQFAHEVRGADGRPLGLVHRDVSPQNLMTDESGRTKVLDFGLAKATAETGTKTGGLKGKIAYMPPEQIESAALDRRVDVFALGAVLWELVCGQPLYPGRSEAELLQQAFFLPLPHPHDVAPDLPQAIVEVLVNALARNKHERTRDAISLAEALRPFIRDDAQEALSVRLSTLFEPQPRTAGEAMGLPPTPQRGELPPPVATRAAPRRTRSDPRLTRPRTTTAERPLLPPPPARIRPRASSPPASERRDTPVESRAAVGARWSDESEDELSVTDAQPRRARPSRAPKLVGLAIVLLLGAGGLVAAPLFGPLLKPTFTTTVKPTLERWMAAVAEKLASTEVEPAAAPQGSPSDDPSAPSRRAAAPKKRTSGVLVVQSNRPAVVTENGRELGPTPLRLTRPVGKRRLEVFPVDGAKAQVLDVEVVAGKEIVADVAFP